MSDIVIRVENMGKLYLLGEREPYVALRDILARALKAPARLLTSVARRERPNSGELWALNDVSFTVRQGDVIGILGRNGVGKAPC